MTIYNKGSACVSICVLHNRMCVYACVCMYVCAHMSLVCNCVRMRTCACTCAM